jgi:hypothetical protein
MSQVITANRLSDGVVVYFVQNGAWTAELDQANCFASTSELEAGLSLAKADEKRNLIVDPFAVDLKATNEKTLEPVSLRNAIRAKGPTIDYRPRPEASSRS